MNYRTIHLPGIKLSFFNWRETLAIFISVFLRKEYAFRANTKTPFILDCGAHIGLGVLWFKKHYPQSNIVAFEPNPRTFKLLGLNIKQNKLKNVKVVNAALSNNETGAIFYVGKDTQPKETWGDTLFKSWFKEQDGFKKIEVRTIKLSNYINKPVDFLKMDIEGAETKVFEEIGNKLSLIKEIVFEFHKIPGNKKQSNPRIIYELLRNNDFAYKIERKVESKGRCFLIIHARKK